MKHFNPTDFFITRIPTLPFKNLNSLNEAMIDNDLQSVKDFISDIRFLNALYFASNDFYHITIQWLKEEEVFNASDKILISLYKYYSRMAARCTPYGLFAGFGMGTIHNKESNLSLKDLHLNPKVRADMFFLKKIKDYILNEEHLNNIPYYSNNTIYDFGDYIRYISWDSTYNYEISEIDKDFFLESIIDLAKNGAFLDDIRKFLTDQLPSGEVDEIEGYLISLIDSNILVDRLPPFMTSTLDPVKELKTYLDKYTIPTNILDEVKSVQDKIDSTSIFLEETVINIDNLTKKLSTIIDIKNQMLQIDSQVFLDESTISNKVTSLLSKRAKELIPLVKRTTNYRLDNFTNKFYAKFENMEVPLVKALDPDFGVGYDFQVSGNLEETPLLDNIYFTFKNRENTSIISPLQQLVLEKYINCFSYSDFKVITITENDIKKIAGSNPDELSFGYNHHIFGSFICDSLDDLDSGNFKFYANSPIPTPFANIVLSRFAYHDVELNENVKKITERDKEDLLYVELLHHREDRLGNVLLRPNFYNFELPYASESKGSDSNIIHINDLWVRIENGKLILRSKKLNKEIKPRFTNAYNYSENQLPMVKFLGDFQFYGVDLGFKWDWGTLEKNAYLPRVEYKELILSEARWRIDQDKSLNISKLVKLLKDLCIPRLCTIKERDNVLLLDTSNEICLNILLKQIKKENIFIYEFFETMQLHNSKNEFFSSEFIFPYTGEIENIEVNNNLEECDSSAKRIFFPGDDWSFYKIYCSHKFGDTVVKDVISEFVKSISTNDTEAPWFFIRYQDPEYHIRFRIKEKLRDLDFDNLNRLLKDFSGDELNFVVQIDTYKREIERYGWKNIEHSEELFHHDSIAIMEFLKIINTDENTRWKVAILSIHFFMRDFEVPTDIRVKLFNDLYQNFMAEHVDQSNREYVQKFKKSINKKYRENKDFVEKILFRNDYTDIEEYVPPFTKRSERIKNIVTTIKSNIHSENESIKLLQDYVHMNMNRIFLTKARMHEFVIYYFLSKTYNSILKRNDK